MNAGEVLIRKLCMDCSRRNDVCRYNPPTYTDAYRCKWDDAQREFKKMAEAFVDTPNKSKEPPPQFPSAGVRC